VLDLTTRVSWLDSGRTIYTDLQDGLLKQSPQSICLTVQPLLQLFCADALDNKLEVQRTSPDAS